MKVCVCHVYTNKALIQTRMARSIQNVSELWFLLTSDEKIDKDGEVIQLPKGTLLVKKKKTILNHRHNTLLCEVQGDATQQYTLETRPLLLLDAEDLLWLRPIAEDLDRYTLVMEKTAVWSERSKLKEHVKHRTGIKVTFTIKNKAYHYQGTIKEVKELKNGYMLLVKLEKDASKQLGGLMLPVTLAAIESITYMDTDTQRHDEHDENISLEISANEPNASSLHSERVGEHNNIPKRTGIRNVDTNLQGTQKFNSVTIMQTESSGGRPTVLTGSHVSQLMGDNHPNVKKHPETRKRNLGVPQLVQGKDSHRSGNEIAEKGAMFQIDTDDRQEDKLNNVQDVRSKLEAKGLINRENRKQLVQLKTLTAQVDHILQSMPEQDTHSIGILKDILNDTQNSHSIACVEKLQEEIKNDHINEVRRDCLMDHPGESTSDVFCGKSTPNLEKESLPDESFEMLEKPEQNQTYTGEKQELYFPKALLNDNQNKLASILAKQNVRWLESFREHKLLEKEAYATIKAMKNPDDAMDKCLSYIFFRNEESVDKFISLIYKDPDCKYVLDTATVPSKQGNKQKGVAKYPGNYASRYNEETSNDSEMASTKIHMITLRQDEVMGELNYGSKVEFKMSDKVTGKGTIKWIGHIGDPEKIIAGLELLDGSSSNTNSATNNGKLRGQQVFDCSEGRGQFVWINQCNALRIASSVSDKYVVNDQQDIKMHTNKDVKQPSKASKELMTLKQEEVSGELNYDSLVEFTDRKKVTRTGIIRWLGHIGDPQKVIAGVEMDYSIPAYENDPSSSGIFYGKKLLDCGGGKCYFIQLNRCRADPRFQTSKPSVTSICGIPDTDDEIENIRPLSSPDMYLGRWKGIQGHYNSCYLDATLFAMFAFNDSYDDIVAQEKEHKLCDTSAYIANHLRIGIINPLRKKAVVNFRKITKLRDLLDKLGTSRGLTENEKDPEEFLTTLFEHALRLEPFLQLSNEQGTFMLLILAEKDRQQIPTAQRLLNQSCLQNSITLKKTPKNLILQMPRSGKAFKMYDMIYPSAALQLNDIVDNAYKYCIFCHGKATFYCKECCNSIFKDSDRVHAYFCDECSSRRHAKKDRTQQRHNATKLHRPNKEESQSQMELYAILCINRSHYVAFVKCGEPLQQQWIFFDSMADREDEYNIPEIKQCDEINDYMKPGGHSKIINNNPVAFQDEETSRFFSDQYLCFYRRDRVQSRNSDGSSTV